MFRSKSSGLAGSSLFDQRNFYQAFLNDLVCCKRQVIIESPFISSGRMARLMPALQRLRRNGVQIIVNTRDPREHDQLSLQQQARAAIKQMQFLGIQVLFTGGHHRKLAIIDSNILWEGSLNILSQGDSCEIMRRIESTALAEQMIQFININAFLE